MIRDLVMSGGGSGVPGIDYRSCDLGGGKYYSHYMIGSNAFQLSTEIVWTGSSFAVFGGGNNAMRSSTSQDGINWTFRPGYQNTVLEYATGISATGRNLLGTFVANGKIFAFHVRSGTPYDVRVISSSDNGISWTPSGSFTGVAGLQGAFSTMFWTGTRYVFSTVGTLATSTDGINWTTSTGISAAGTPTAFGNAHVWTNYANGVFRAYASIAGAQETITSTDGVTWSNSSNSNVVISKPTWYPSCGVFAGFVGANIYTSADGVNWTLRYTTPDGTTITSIEANPASTFMMAVSSGSASGPFYSTNGGTTWVNYGNIATAGGTALLLKCSGGIWVLGAWAVAQGSPFIWTSTNNGATWTDVSTNLRGPWLGNAITAIEEGGGTVVAIARNDTSYSTDRGESWTKYASPGVLVTGLAIAYGAGTFVVFDGLGNLFTSPTGVNWTSRGAVPSANGGGSVCFGAGRFITGPSNGVYATSTDGINWVDAGASLNNVASSPSGMRFKWTGSAFIGLANGTRFTQSFVTSPDGINWTALGTASLSSATGGSNMFDIAFSGSRYVAVGGTGYVISSTDGVTWTRNTAFSAAWGTITISRVDWIGNMFVLLSDYGRMAYSLDGLNWTILPITPPNGNLIGGSPAMLKPGKLLIASGGTFGAGVASP